MGIYYTLVNHSKQEKITFRHVGGMKFSEIAGYTVTSTIVTYYMLKNVGDHISFVADTETIWPFPSGTYTDLEHYSDVTESITDELVTYGYLADDGREMLFEDDPDSYIRRLRQIWND